MAAKKTAAKKPTSKTAPKTSALKKSASKKTIAIAAKKAPASTTKKAPASTTKKAPASTTKKAPAITTKQAPAKQAPAIAAKKAPAKKTAKKAPAIAAKKAPTKKTPEAEAAPSTTPLAVRLGVAGGVFHIDNAPHGFELLIPPGVEFGIDLPERLGPTDAVLAFVQDRSQVEYLAQRLKKAWPKKNVDGEVLLWVAYPKGGKRTDINRDTGWETFSALKLVGVAQVAVDGVWSALRFRHTSKTTRVLG